MPTAIEVLRANRREIVGAASTVGRKRLRAMLSRAQGMLNQRLRQAEGLGGPGKESFSAHQMRAVLGQLELVLRQLSPDLKGLAADTAEDAVDPAVGGVVEYLRAAEKQFAGITERLPIRDALLFERAHSGVQSSVLHRLEGDPKRGPGILDRYGDAVVARFEGHLQQRLLARTPWADVRNGLIADSPFLQQAPAFWAERIVRTEAMNGSNRAIWEANQAADEQLGDVVKVLSATFDNRTGADSVAVHGQIRRPQEPFDWWDGPYQHPPNRPNDREVVVTHRLSWPLPDELKWRSDAEVARTWAANGRTGVPPARPKMTTVDVDQFGKVKAPPPKAPIVEPPEVPERAKRGPIASPFFDENVTPYQSPEPEAAPEVQVLPEPVDFMAEREGGQLGSNPGGLYRGSDKRLRYVKFYKDPVQAELERLANNIYKDLGLPAVKSETFEHEGKAAHASEVVEGETLKSKGLKKADAKKVLKGFAADVLVGNWDAVGLEHDNIIMSGGKAYRIDQGGALLHRAKAGLKPEAALHKIDEWEKFFDPHTNPAYAKVAQAAGVKRAEDVPGLKAQLEAVKKLRNAHGSWGKYVDHVSPGLPGDVRQKVVDMLSVRARLLDDKLKALKKAKLPAPGTPRIFEHLPEQPVPLPKHVPEGFESHRVYKEQVRQKLDAMLAKDQGKELERAIGAFTGHNYPEIRDASKLTPEEFRRRHNEDIGPYKKQYERIDKAFDQAPQVGPESSVKEAFRGIHGLSREAFDRIIGAEHFEADSVSSTSWDPNVAQQFAGTGRPDKYAVLLHFKPKQSSRNWLAVETHSRFEHEYEILLRKGTRFRVAGVRRAAGRHNVAILELDEE